ncbi:hypothetical protein [Streptomyces sp. XH2]|uniref:hypothetical protein n=1 Tax=Streptomyces sp. XH2 TaxID=3412483 RepID=UPI003C7E785B
MTWYRNDDGIYTRHEPPGHQLHGDLDLGLTTEDMTRYDAHHEAGHAVLGLLKGMPVRRATLEPNDLHSAHVEFGPWSSLPWWSYALMMAAGDRAGDRWLREAGLWTPQRAWIAERGCDSDRRKVAETVPGPSVVIFGALPAGAQPQQGVAHYQSLQDEVDFWLDMYWPSVQKLANAMTEFRELSSHQISDVTGIALTQAAVPVSTEGEA